MQNLKLVTNSYLLRFNKYSRTVRLIVIVGLLHIRRLLMYICRKLRQESLLMNSSVRSVGKLIQKSLDIQKGQDQLRERILLLQNGLQIQLLEIMDMLIMHYSLVRSLLVLLKLRKNIQIFPRFLMGNVRLMPS